MSHAREEKKERVSAPPPLSLVIPPISNSNSLLYSLFNEFKDQQIEANIIYKKEQEPAAKLGANVAHEQRDKRPAEYHTFDIPNARELDKRLKLDKNYFTFNISIAQKPKV